MNIWRCCNQVTLLAGNRHGIATSPLTIRVSQLIPSQTGDLNTPPPGLTNVVSLAVGCRHRLALTADGRVQAWGLLSGEQELLLAHLTNVIAVAAGSSQSLALTTKGR
jgi:alpha-tubulin suppressor-like RCC1 family protein